MVATGNVAPEAAFGAFRHEALLYEGVNGFVERTAPFIDAAVQASEPILVVVSADKIARLRGRLGDDARRVRFEDMTHVGSNPARIIPVWRDFVEQSARPGVAVRGIGEPVWAERTPEELAECARHESLINLAFSGGTPWWLVCPYDVSTLSQDVIARAQRTHHAVVGIGDLAGTRKMDLGEIALPFDDPLAEPAAVAHEISIGLGALETVRQAVAAEAIAAGLGDTRRSDLVIAVNEIASNSIRHGGGVGRLRIWRDARWLVCEVSDRGRILDPLVGRRRPTLDQESGRGVWLANQLCDLVQVRTFPTGSVVRMFMAR